MPGRGQQDSPLELAAGMVVAMDKDTEEPDNATERILAACWHSVQSVQKNPLGFARSAPFNALSSEDKATAESAHSFFDSFLAAPVLTDSTAEDIDMRAKPECTQFINYLLPGEVKTDSWDGTPVAAEVWKTVCGGWSDPAPFVELARTHPGDQPEDNAIHELTGSQCDDGYGPGYQPLTTKAGSRLWSISFAEPGSDARGDPPFAMLRAAYPLQLLVRFDRGRQLLVYEAFENRPPLKCTIKAQLDAGVAPVTAQELRAIEGLLKRTSHQRESMGRMLAGMMATAGAGDDDDVEGAGALVLPSPSVSLPHLE